MRWAAVLALGLSACAPGADVVARAIDDGGGVPKEVEKPGRPANDPGCGKAATTLAVLTKSDELHRFDNATKTAIDGGPVKCLSPGVSAIAVDRKATPWIASGGKLTLVDPNGPGCKVVDPTLSPSAMTFVWDPEGVSEMLYGLVEGVLVVVHPATFVRTPIGKLALEDVRGLAGTGDGRLVAFAGDLVVTIAYVALGDASLKSTWQIKSPEPTRGRFVGGVVTESGFDLVFGANVYTYDPVKGSLGRPTPLFPQDPGVIAVSAAPCTPGPK